MILKDFFTAGCKSVCVGTYARAPVLGPRHAPHRSKPLCSSVQLPMCWCYNHETCALLTRRGKKNKVHTVFVSPEDIISRWVAVAVNSSQHPPPLLSHPIPTSSSSSCSVWRQIHWFPVSQWTCKGHSYFLFFVFYEKEREKKIHFTLLCAWFVQPLQNGSSVIVLCSWAMIWILCRPEWEKMILSGLSVCVRSETRDFKASSVFMWMTGVAMLPLLLLFKPGGEWNTHYFCDHVRYSLFLVFKKKKNRVTIKLPNSSVLPECVCCENVSMYIFLFFWKKKMFLIRH